MKVLTNYGYYKIILPIWEVVRDQNLALPYRQFPITRPTPTETVLYKTIDVQISSLHERGKVWRRISDTVDEHLRYHAGSRELTALLVAFDCKFGPVELRREPMAIKQELKRVLANAYLTKRLFFDPLGHPYTLGKNLRLPCF